MKDKSVSEQQLGKYDLTDNAIRSGFELVDDIVGFFDKIYYHFQWSIIEFWLFWPYHRSSAEGK